MNGLESFAVRIMPSIISNIPKLKNIFVHKEDLLTSLPQEVLQQIFIWINNPSSLSRTSKYLKELVEDPPLLYNLFITSTLSQKHSKKLAKVFPSLRSRIRSNLLTMLQLKMQGVSINNLQKFIKLSPEQQQITLQIFPTAWRQMLEIPDSDNINTNAPKMLQYSNNTNAIIDFLLTIDNIEEAKNIAESIPTLRSSLLHRIVVNLLKATNYEEAEKIARLIDRDEPENSLVYTEMFYAYCLDPNIDIAKVEESANLLVEESANLLSEDRMTLLSMLFEPASPLRKDSARAIQIAKLMPESPERCNTFQQIVIAALSKSNIEQAIEAGKQIKDLCTKVIVIRKIVEALVKKQDFNEARKIAEEIIWDETYSTLCEKISKAERESPKKYQ